MKIIILISLICLSCFGCTMPSFNEPQPAGKKPLSTFPNKLKGKYMSNDEVSIVTISDKMMICVRDYEFGVRKADLDTNYYISGNELIDKNSGDRERITFRADSVIAHVHEVDTISNLAAGDVLKKFKGYYFLNQGNKEGGWMVTRLALTDGKLTMAYISDSLAINKLKELAEKPLDTVTQQYSISKKKFKILLKSDGFSDQDTFTKVR